MDPCVPVKAKASPSRSQRSEKQWRMKCWFFIFLMLAGLGQGAGQGDPGDPEHRHTCSRTTDRFVTKQQEKDNSEKAEVFPDLIWTKREADPTECTADVNGGGATHATESAESVQPSPTVTEDQSSSHTPLDDTTEEPMENDSYEEDDFYEEDDSYEEEEPTIQQSFSEVHTVRKLLKQSDSVCQILVDVLKVGTGFVLFDNLILTNAHLFKHPLTGQKLEDVVVFAIFNYDDPDLETDSFYFNCKRIIYLDDELDYAILELSPEGQKPPGLLKSFGPVPEEGEACIVGHPAGEVKTMNPTKIIEKKNRLKVVTDYLYQFVDYPNLLHFITQVIKGQGISSVMIGGREAEKVVTYNTFMRHGSSGSPVFDAANRVFGLHTLLYHYVLLGKTYIIMGGARPLLIIFEHFVNKLKESGSYKLLRRVQEEAKGNKYLEKILRDVHEPFDTY